MGDTGASTQRLVLVLRQQRPQPEPPLTDLLAGSLWVAALVLGTDPGQRGCGCAAFSPKARGRQDVGT